MQRDSTGIEPGTTLAQLLERFETSRRGLSTSEARRRFHIWGPNEVTTCSLRAKIFGTARLIANPLVVILLVAGTASALLRQIADAAIIFIIVALSSILNAWQTMRSARAVRRLQQQIGPTATALRDGVWCELPRREIVAGDVVRLSAGDMVPADARVLEATDLHVQQAALTGESLPAEKRPIMGVLEPPPR